jgi:hypothetical protein
MNPRGAGRARLRAAGRLVKVTSSGVCGRSAPAQPGRRGRGHLRLRVSQRWLEQPQKRPHPWMLAWHRHRAGTRWVRKLAENGCGPPLGRAAVKGTLRAPRPRPRIIGYWAGCFRVVIFPYAAALKHPAAIPACVLAKPNDTPRGAAVGAADKLNGGSAATRGCSHRLARTQRSCAFGGLRWSSSGAVGFARGSVSGARCAAGIPHGQRSREADEQEGLSAGQKRKYGEQPGRPHVVARQRLMADFR